MSYFIVACNIVYPPDKTNPLVQHFTNKRATKYTFDYWSYTLFNFLVVSAIYIFDSNYLTF